jgi:hypothetical protein
MNIEPLTLEVVDEHIDKMTEKNTIYDKDADLEIMPEDILLNNIKHGYVVVSMLTSYVESTLNTILRDCVGYFGDILLKLSVDEKLELLYMHYKVNISTLRSFHQWETYTKMRKIRNALTHYKDNHIGYIGHGMGLPQQWSKPYDIIGDFFTTRQMRKAKNDTMSMLAKIAEDFRLSINQNAKVFSCPDYDELPSVYKPNADTFSAYRISQSKGG